MHCIAATSSPVTYFHSAPAGMQVRRDIGSDVRQAGAEELAALSRLDARLAVSFQRQQLLLLLH